MAKELREPVQILGEELQRVQHYTEIERRMEKLEEMQWSVVRQEGIDRRMKLERKVYKTVVRPALLYRAETWATKEFKKHDKT